MTTPTPDDLTTARKRTILIASVVAAAVLLLGVGIAFAVMASRAPKAPVARFTPAEETSATESVDASGSAEASETTRTAVATVAPTTNPQGGTSSATNIRSGKVAYRRTAASITAIYVAGEDGSGEKRVFVSAAGAFALSPDGATLAVMDMPAGSTVQQLVLVDVASGTTVRVSGATEVPTWAPDSSWLAYTADKAGAFSVHRLNRDGTGDVVLLSPAARPRISPDGRYVAYVKTSPAALGDPLFVYDTAHRTSQTVPSANGSLDYAWGPDGSLFFAQAGHAGGKAVLGVADKTLTRSSVIVSLPTTDTLPSSLVPSPDGSKVLLAMAGDEWRSVMYMVDVAGKKVALRATRRDAYPLAWTLDGKSFLYFDGNRGGETSDLYRMSADGSTHVIVVGGASGL